MSLFNLRPKHPPPYLSALPESPAFSRWADDVQVFLDGRKIENCTTAHTKEGWVEICLTDERGAPGFDDDGEPIIYRRVGKVELLWKDES